VERLNLGKLLNTVAGTPVGEAARSIHVGAASVIVADLGCEKFENAFHRFRREGREYCGGVTLRIIWPNFLRGIWHIGATSCPTDHKAFGRRADPSILGDQKRGVMTGNL
jgi:hypothetical protein